MKISFASISIIALFFLTSCSAPRAASAQQVSVSFQLIYDQLSPYGQWASDSDYGYV
jgi:outer membrane biogenesis lipoprotein LolB